jgi:hypothetical protein
LGALACFFIASTPNNGALALVGLGLLFVAFLFGLYLPLAFRYRAIWARLYYCGRHDVVFRDGAGPASRPEDINSLYKGGGSLAACGLHAAAAGGPP